MPVSTKIQHRRDTAANWTSTNPTLNAGEIGFETDTLKFKIGNGSTAWTSLTYQSDASLLSGNATGLTSLTTSGNVTVGGDLTVNGSVTSINSTTITVDDKNLELASVASPTDITADGAGITVKGTTDKTFNWVDATDAWTSSEDFNLLTGKSYEINGTVVLSATQVLGRAVTNAATASTIVARDASGNFLANTITASLTGVASLATNLTGGTANKGEIVYMSGVNTTSKLTATTTNNQVLAYNTATNAPYWATTTGSGNIVYSNSPSFVTPSLGVATGTSINVTGQLISTVATGTAPLSVISTTRVSNLNAATAGVADSATIAGQANNITGVANTIFYNGTANTTSTLGFSTGNNGQVLSVNAAGSLVWTTPAVTGVTNVATGTGLTGGPITSTGTISIDTAVVARLTAAGTFTATQTFQNAANNLQGLIVKNHSTQQTNPFEVQYANGTAMVSVSNVGTLFAVTIDGGTA
jgi:hypothetical protein